MHYVGYAEMAAAVSNAGGLGLITALTITANGGPEALRREIQKARTLTSKPIGVNCTLLPVGVPPDWPAIIQIIIDEKITVVETAGRAPDEIVKKFKDAGIIVMHKCVTIRHALAAAKRGVDIISMDGFDCAGHPGQAPVTTTTPCATVVLFSILISLISCSLLSISLFDFRFWFESTPPLFKLVLLHPSSSPPSPLGPLGRLW